MATLKFVEGPCFLSLHISCNYQSNKTIVSLKSKTFILTAKLQCV